MNATAHPMAIPNQIEPPAARVMPMTAPMNSSALIAHQTRSAIIDALEIT